MATARNGPRLAHSRPEIGKAVADLLVKKFTDHQWVLKDCGSSEDTIRVGADLVAEAKDLAGRLRSESRGSLRELLPPRLTLSKSEISVGIRSTGLVAILGHAHPAEAHSIGSCDWSGPNASFCPKAIVNEKLCEITHGGHPQYAARAPDCEALQSLF